MGDAELVPGPQRTRWSVSAYVCTRCGARLAPWVCTPCMLCRVRLWIWIRWWLPTYKRGFDDGYHSRPSTGDAGKGDR